MAKKKGRMGKIFGAIAGSPYERLLKQVDKLVEASVNDRMLAKNLQKLQKFQGQKFLSCDQNILQMMKQVVSQF